jgi:hypothetical protein
MTTHRIIYEGPASLAVPTATLLADAEGVELTSSQTPEHRGQAGAEVVLALTVEASSEAIAAAVARIREGLPSSATITMSDEAS